MERELWQYLKTADKPIVLYGMGNGADKIINVLENYGIPFQGVFASDGFVREKFFHSHIVTSYSNLKEKFPNMIVLLCFGSSLPNVLENILKIASKQELYAPDVPVIGEGLFTEKYYLENKKQLDFVYSRLADDISRQTFLSIINYKLSGKIEYLLNCQVTADEPYNSFLNLLEDECFLDLGAYNGDTVTDFVKRVKSYSRIVALEPDKKSFKKLMQNTSEFKNITLINACVSDHCGSVGFAMQGGRNSSVNSSCAKTDCISVDSLKLCPTFIKMDVEGEEVKAVTGAKNTILSCKPKMLISAYHRTDDLISIPNAVFKIRDDYKLYLRHFSYLPAWDTNYYFV